jgi:hypothetical protein
MGELLNLVVKDLRVRALIDWLVELGAATNVFGKRSVAEDEGGRTRGALHNAALPFFDRGIKPDCFLRRDGARVQVVLECVRGSRVEVEAGQRLLRPRVRDE